jgi:hypothetical protein
MGSALWKKSHKKPQIIDGVTYPGTGQDEKDEDDRLEFIVERNEDPDYSLH